MRKKSIGYLPGGEHEYMNSALKILGFIQKRNPTREELREWFELSFPSTTSKTSFRTGVSILKNAELIKMAKDVFTLTDSGTKFLQTRNARLVFENLAKNYLGMNEIVRLLREKPRTIDEISSSLNTELRLNWKSTTNWKVRMNWLENLGYVTTEGRDYLLTSSGNRVAKVEGQEAEVPKHKEIVKWIIETGQAHNWVSEREYPLDNYKLDAVWKQNAGSAPLAVFEVHVRGNLYQALVKLKYARGKWNSKLFLVTTEKYLQTAKSLVHNSFPDLAMVLAVLDWKAMNNTRMTTLEYFRKMKGLNLNLYIALRQKSSKTSKRTPEKKKAAAE